MPRLIQKVAWVTGVRVEPCKAGRQAELGHAGRRGIDEEGPYGPI